MVGSSIVRALRENGYGNINNGGNIFTQTREDLDLTNSDDVKRWFEKLKPKVVVIAAAKVGGIYANHKYPYDFLSENIKIQQNLFEAAWKFGSKRLLFLGSSCIYPKNSKIPIKEEELLSSYLEKTNESYAIAKIAGIKLCEAISTQYDFDAISLMPTNLYGLGDNYDSESSHVMAALLKKFILAKRKNLKTVTCWGTGKPFREFLYVDDLGLACVHVLEKWDPKNPESPKDINKKNLYYLNVGSGEEISIKNLADKIAKEVGYDGDIIWETNKPDGTFRKTLDSARIESIGWKSKINLTTGIKKTVQIIEKALDNPLDKGASLKNFC